MRNFSATPKKLPRISVRTQLFGWTNPKSRQDVFESRAQSRTSTALSGARIKLPARTATTARIPNGPKPRRRLAKPSLGVSADPIDAGDNEVATCSVIIYHPEKVGSAVSPLLLPQRSWERGYRGRNASKERSPKHRAHPFRPCRSPVDSLSCIRKPDS